MVKNYIIVCPICGKRTWLRIQDGAYLKEYPIRVNCINCRTLLKGTYIMASEAKAKGLNMTNARVEEADVDIATMNVKNADYVAEVSGELPCANVKPYEGGVPLSPYLKTVDSVDEKYVLETIEERKLRLKHFENNMLEWRRVKGTAFQLLDEGSIDYIPIAIQNRMGKYNYLCDNYLKTLHCLQEIVLEETHYLFLESQQSDSIMPIFEQLAQLDKDEVQLLIDAIGGTDGLIAAYRKVIEIFSKFMDIYPNILPAETFLRYKEGVKADKCISTCSFGDIKTFYQDAYEALLAVLYVPVCLDNIRYRGSFQRFEETYNDVYCPERKQRDFKWYCKLDNGTRINKYNETEFFQKSIILTANRKLRNGIGHNNIKYDGVKQTVIAYDLKNPKRINYNGLLMDIAIDCIGLTKSTVLLSEIILFLLRFESKKQSMHSIIHPKCYKNAEMNAKCPCGSGIKFKKCCRDDILKLLRYNAKE